MSSRSRRLAGRRAGRRPTTESTNDDRHRAAGDRSRRAPLPSRRWSAAPPSPSTIAPASGSERDQRHDSRTRASRPSRRGVLVRRHPRSRSVASTSIVSKRLVDAEHDREADRRLGGGEHDDEDGEHLPVVAAAAVAREGHVVDVGRVQDELDAHQDADRVAPREHAEEAEQRRGCALSDHEVAERRRSLHQPLTSLRDTHDRADQRRQQHERRDLEGQHVVGEEARCRCRRSSARRRRGSVTTQVAPPRDRAASSAARCRRRPARRQPADGAVRHLHVGDPVRQHDREQRQHQDAADVDQELHDAEEVGAEQHEERRPRRAARPSARTPSRRCCSASATPSAEPTVMAASR